MPVDTTGSVLQDQVRILAILREFSTVGQSK